MKRHACVLLLGWMLWSLAACAGVPGLSVTPAASATVSPTPSPTQTIVWFPPSETPTPQPALTRQPTPEQKPGVGQVLFSDDFASPRPWNPAVSEEATVSMDHGRLAIAVQPGVTAFRIRQGPAFTDFFAEITARPSLCRGADEYGLLFRAPSNAASYAFVLSCDGAARFERVRLGRSYPIHPAVASADVPLGAPGEVRLGVWVSGAEMRFFLNGRYQFGATDPALKSGALGVFARSTGDTPVTVLFSDLAVHAISVPRSSGTPTP